MCKLYKLTDKGFTRNNTEWRVGETVSIPKKSNPRICSSDVLHAYTHLNLGLLMNPIHANIQNPTIFECSGDIAVEDWDKVGCFSMHVTKEIKLPKWYADLDMRKNVQVQFAILCAEAAYPIYCKYALEDAVVLAAITVAKEYLANKTTDAAADAADAAAYAAANAADAAADAADAAAYAAGAAANAADAAAYAAYAARAAAYAALSKNIDFSELADLAVKMITEG